jgi:hypothetical protein
VGGGKGKAEGGNWGSFFASYISLNKFLSNLLLAKFLGLISADFLQRFFILLKISPLGGGVSIN